MRVLLVEDDQATAEFIKVSLERSGYEVFHAANGLTAYDLAQVDGFSVAIIDLMLPGLDGIELIRNLRKEKKTFPILILSAKGAVKDKVVGLESGADDYLTKPFSIDELHARLQALLRRGEKPYEPEVLELADLSVNLSTRKVYRADKAIELQPKEFDLLVYLMRNPGRVIPKSMIMEHVWDFSFDPMSNVLEARICYLRDKIDRGFDKQLIRTIRRVGYMISDED